MRKETDKLKDFFLKSYLRYYNIISLNKNLLISGIAGFICSIIIAHLSFDYFNNYFLNSALTVITGFIIYKIIFAILFHHDNKRKYTKRFTGKINFPILKKIIVKMMFASTIFDSVNNISRFFLIIELIKLNYSAVEAATISSLIASSFSYLVINIIVKYIHLFGSKKR